MKHITIITAVLVALLITTFFNCYAQSAEVEKTFMKIIEKYDDTENVTCLTATKGNGLEFMKMMFNKEFGKDFMKGVTSISFIEYSDAAEEISTALRKDLDAFKALLSEINLSGVKQFSDNKFLRCFATTSDDASISDFVVAMEDDESKMLLYMAGTIKVTF